MATEDNNGNAATIIIDNQGRAEEQANARHGESKAARMLIEDAAKVRHRESEDAMVKRHRESEDTLRIDHRATEDAAQSRHRETKDDDRLTKRHLSLLCIKVATLCTCAVLLTLLWTWYVGRPFEAALGLVPEDTVSGKQMAAEHHDYVAMQVKVAKLEEENKSLHWLWHSHNLYVALMEDDIKFLSKVSTGMNAWEFLQNQTATRSNGFINIALDGEHPNLRSWIETNHPKQVASTPLGKWESEYYKEVALNLAREEHQQNKLRFMFGLFFDSAVEIQSVDLTALPEDWMPFYQPVIDRLIETNSKYVLPLLDGSQFSYSQDQHPIGGE